MAFPQEQLPVTAELYVSTLGWVDITDDVRLGSADSGGGVTITRGRPNEGTEADPGKCDFVLNNRHGKYSPRNPRSEYCGLIGRNSPVRFGITMAADDFNRTNPSNWGAAPTGQNWGHAGPATWNITAGTARCVMATADSYNKAELFVDYHDVEQVTTFTAPVTSGAPVHVGHVARVQANGDCFWLRVEFHPAGVVGLTISRWSSSGGLITLANMVVPNQSYNGSVPLRFRSSVVGSKLACKVWTASETEPRDWQLEAVFVGGLSGWGHCGHHIWLAAGNTTTKPYTVQFDNYQAINRRGNFEVPAWPPKWDLSGQDRWVDIGAAGVLQRLGQGERPLQSALRRAFNATLPDLLAYYPLEDGANNDLGASGILGGAPMTEIGKPPGSTQIGTGDVDGTVEWGIQGSGGAASLVGLRNGGRLRVNIPASTETSWTFEAVARYDAGTDIGVDSIMFTLRLGNQWEWSIGHAGNGTPGGAQYFLIAGSVDGSISGTTITWPHDPYDGILHHYRVDALRDGANTDYWIYIDGELLMSGTWVSFNSVPPDSLTVNHYLGSGPDMPAVGHVALTAPSMVGTVGDRPNATRAWYGESAANRMRRLAAEEGVELVVLGDANSTTQVGPQRVITFLEHIKECAAADGGILGESRDSLDLIYRPRYTLYNQTPLPLSYSGGHISEPFEPVDDDDNVTNDVTVKREGGSEWRAVLEAGPLSVQRAPAGIGLYDSQKTINVPTDSALRDQAWWALRHGTVDEPRYPRIHVDLSSSAYAADENFTERVSAVDAGDGIRVSDLPEWLPPRDAEVMARGYTETMDAFDWDIVFNCTPLSPWTVATADGVARVGAEGSVIAVSTGRLPVNGMSFVLQSNRSNGPWVTTNATDFPMNILIGGAEPAVVAAIQPLAQANFAVDGTNGWPNAVTGQAWTANGGTASDYLVTGGTGRITQTSVNVLRHMILDVVAPNIRLQTDIIIPTTVAVGAPITHWLLGRVVDLSNYYAARLDLNTAGVLSLVLVKRVAGSLITLGSPVVVETNVAGQSYRVTLELSGSTIVAEAFNASINGNGARIGLIDGDISAAGAVGVACRRETGNTNTNPQTAFDNFAILNPQRVTLSSRATPSRNWAGNTTIDVLTPAAAAL